MSVLLLVRHGQASFGAADYDRLSPLGERQSRLVGEALAARGVRPDLLVRGSLRRHRQTAEAAVGAAGWTGEVVQDAGWDELDRRTTPRAAVAEQQRQASSRDAVGGSPGVPEDPLRAFQESVSRWASGRHDADYHESFPAFQQRVSEALHRTLARLGPGQTGVVLTSGGPVAWVTSTLTGNGSATWRRLADVVVNSSVTKVVSGRRGVSLVTFNDHGHLEPGPGLVTYY